MHQRLLLIALNFILTCSAFTQVRFVRGYSDQPMSAFGTTGAFDLIELNGNGYVISANKGKLIKTDLNGVPLWEKKILRNNIEALNSFFPILAYADNNEFYSGGNFNADTMIIMKIGASGNILWSKSFVAKSISTGPFSKASDGGLICTMSRQGSGGMAEAMILKMDPNGNILWHKKYSAPNPNERIAIQDAHSLPNGNILISGVHQVSTTYYAFIGMLNSNGSVSWVKQMVNPGLSGAAVPQVCQLANGNIRAVMALLENSIYLYSIDFDPNGNFISGNKYTGISNSVYGISINADGTITGHIVSSGSVIRINPAGTIDISSTFKLSTLYVLLERVIATSDNGIAFTGIYTVNPFSEFRCLFVKAGTDGTVPGNYMTPFTIQKTSYTNSTATSTLIDSVVSLGISLNLTTGPFTPFYDTLFTLSTGIVANPKGSFEYSLMPNPVNDILTLTGPDNISRLQVMDALGKVVFMQENISFPFKIETKNYPEGIYYIQMLPTIGAETQVQKLIIHH